MSKYVALRNKANTIKRDEETQFFKFSSGSYRLLYLKCQGQISRVT